MQGANKKVLLGVFVVGALVIAVIAVMIFGGGRLLENDEDYLLYFEKPVNGLSIGAPVLLQGVKIGRVKSIRLIGSRFKDIVESYDKNYSKPKYGLIGSAKPLFEEGKSSLGRWQTEVVVGIHPEALGFRCHWYSMFWDDGVQTAMDELLCYMVLYEGLRAQLKSVSMVTGQTCISLNYCEDDRKYDDLLKQLCNDELPTSMSVFDRMIQKIGSQESENIVEKILIGGAQLSNFIQDGRFERMIDNLSRTIDNASNISTNLASETDKMLESLRNGLDEFRHLSVSIDEMVAANRPNVDNVILELRACVHDVTDVSKSAVALIEQLRSDAEEGAAVRWQLRENARALEQLCNALHDLSIQISADPQMLIFGKQD